MSFKAKLLCVILQFFMLMYCIPRVVNSSPSNYSLGAFINCLHMYPNPTSNNSIAKVIYTPQNATFNSVLNAYVRTLRFNTSASTPKPLAIVTALESSHVQATIMCAKAHGLEMRTRSGGHDYEGMSYVSSNPFIILDLYNLRSISIDLRSSTAWVQSGATLGELYYKIANLSNKHAFPAGVCPTVAVGGHFTGGGYGNLLRKYGLTIDNIIDAEIVDANGKILNRKSMGEDLFWAIRGGGGASFCVILAWRIKLVEVPERVTTFYKIVTLEEGASDIFDQWQHVAPNLDPNLFIRAEARVQPLDTKTKKNTIYIYFQALYLGGSESLLELMDKHFPLLGLNKTNCEEMRWIESTLYFYGYYMNVTSLEILLDRFKYFDVNFDKQKSDYLKEPIPKAGLDTLWKKMLELENVHMHFNPYGGKMNEIPDNATPFPHRKGNLCKILYYLHWFDNSTEVANKYMEEINEMYNFMTPYVSNNPREAFLNYRDIEIGTNANKNVTFGLDYFKGNLKRLLKVKAKVDPTNFFRNEQSIPVFGYMKSK